MDPWLIGLAVTIVCGLIGVIYWAGQSRDDKQDERMERIESHVEANAKEIARAHERSTALETDNINAKTEIRGLREMRHEIMSHTTEALASWYTRVVEMIDKFRGSK